MYYLELLTTIFKWMFGETTISQVKVWNHAIEKTFINSCLGLQVYIRNDAIIFAPIIRYML